MNIKQPDQNECIVDLGDVQIKIADKRNSPAGLIVDADGADGYPLTVDLSHLRK